MSGSVCLKCEEPIPGSRRADARFCSDACRGAAEYERRRLQRRLEHLEDAELQWRCWPGYERQLAHVQDQIAEAEARLRTLLGG
jgi:hypothetical protein